jgi:hypothetical protein
MSQMIDITTSGEGPNWSNINEVSLLQFLESF